MSIEISDDYLREILSKSLSEDYPEDVVELWEGWELIACIFYKAGLDDVLKLRAEKF